MDSKRIKSIDIFRGLCMTWMILAHLFEWWLKPEYSWLRYLMSMILDPIGASGFLFISGVSITLSYRNRIIKLSSSNELNWRIVRNSYFFRAFSIFLVALIYNFMISLSLNDFSWIWTWFVLLTAAVSLFLTWPLLKTSRLFRIIFGIIILILNEVFLLILLPYNGEPNIFGLVFHLLYHNISQDPILNFFPFFLFGTVIGDTIFYLFFNNKENKYKNQSLRMNYLILCIICGIFLIFFGILLNYPNFLKRRSFSWTIYSIGIILVLISIFLIIEFYEIIKPLRSYKFLFYYSYYSLTIYLAHNLLYFLFYHQLNVINIWFFIVVTYVFMGILLRIIYKVWEGKLSIKVQIGKFSLKYALKIEERLKKNTVKQN